MYIHQCSYISRAPPPFKSLGPTLAAIGTGWWISNSKLKVESSTFHKRKCKMCKASTQFTDQPPPTYSLILGNIMSFMNLSEIFVSVPPIIYSYIAMTMNSHTCYWNIWDRRWCHIEHNQRIYIYGRSYYKFLLEF